MTDVYEGALNWDKIYRRFHSADKVAQRVDRELDSNVAPVLFAGFPKAASDLARNRPVTFVDLSHAIVSDAVETYSNLNKTVVGDVLSQLFSCQAPHIVLSGRVTAFWTSDRFFEMFRAGASAFERTKIIVDFFDAEQFPTEGVFLIENGPDCGEWRVLERKSGLTTDPISTWVRLRVTYFCDGLKTEYETDWRCFDTSQILRWGKAHFSDLKVRIEPSSIPGDPSFSLTMARRETQAKLKGTKQCR